MNKKILGISIAILIIAQVVIWTERTFAAPEWFVVTPRIVDLKTKADEEVTFTVQIQNTYPENLELFGLVYHLGNNGEKIYFDDPRVDRPSSLAKWFKFQRSRLAVAAKKTTTLEITVDPHTSAKPGMYHAMIIFTDKNDQEEAAKNSDKALAVMVNVEILSSARELLMIKRFAPEYPFTSENGITILYNIANSGNRKSKPEGVIRIYNRRGEEVATTPINASGESLEPGMQKQFASIIDTIQGMGQFKAFLDLSYGDDKQKILQDTTFFWVIPWKEILAAIIVLMIFIVCCVHWLHGRYTKESSEDADGKQVNIFKNQEAHKQLQSHVIDLREKE